MSRSLRVGLALGGPVLALAVILVARPADQSSTGWFVVVGLLALLGLVALFGVRDLARMFRADDPEATAIAARLGERSEQRFLIERWLRRSRRHRNIGGAAGVVGGLIAGGIPGLILFGLIGLTAGSLLSELHLIGPDRLSAGHRTAGLQRRSLASYWNLRHQVAMALVAATAAGLIVGDRLGRLGFGFRPGWAVAAIAAVAAALGLQWRVAARRRPALPSSLRKSDNLVRALAITQGIANPTLSLSLAFVGQSLWESNSVLAAAAWIAALMLYWGGRRLGLDWMLDQPPLQSLGALGSSRGAA
jgi:hypothetical protein